MATIPAPTDGGSGVSPALQLMQMIDGYWLSQVVHVTAKFGVADHLADGPKTSQALAHEIAADPDALYRLLRACAGFGLLREGESRTFALTPRWGTYCAPTRRAPSAIMRSPWWRQGTGYR